LAGVLTWCAASPISFAGTLGEFCWRIPARRCGWRSSFGRLRAELATDTRIAIGIGCIDHIDARQISLSTGEAFVLSGRAMDGMTGYFDLAGALPARAGIMALWFTVALRLCSGLIRPWTRRQAEIAGVALMLDHPTHERIAKALVPEVAKQTVSDSVAGSGWRPLMEAVNAFEKTDWRAALGPEALAPQDSRERLLYQ
jgi:hypothetical protein